MIWLSLALAWGSPSGGSPDWCDELDTALSDDSGIRCGTDALHKARIACPEVLRKHALSTAEPVLGVGAFPRGGKITRDSAGSWDNLIETENFAIKWGSDPTVVREDVQLLADSFERAWTEELDGLGYPQPRQSGTYRFNVYIGDTGSPAPSANGNGGYFWYDDDGYPLIVMNREAVYQTQWGYEVALHEFFHAIQDAAGSYAYEGAGAWYYEATASWVELEVIGATTSNSGFLFGFALLPDLSVGFFDYPDEGTLQEYHQYGAFVFIRHIAESLDDSDLIRRSWVEAPRNGDPLLELDELFAERGTSLAEVHTDFSRRLPRLDFPDGDVYERALQGYENYYANDRRFEGTLVVGEPVGAVPANPPQSWGNNTWKVQVGGEIAVTFTPASSPDAFTAELSARSGDEIVRWEIPTDGTPVQTDGLLGLTDIMIVVTAQADTDDYTSTFPYQLLLEPVVEGADTDTDTDLIGAPLVCACSTGSPSSALWLVIPLGLAVRRRRSLAGS